VIADEDHVVDARHFVGEQLARWGQRGVADAVVLLTSEVVSNAVNHAGSDRPGTELTVVLRCDPGVVRVEVADGSSVPPVRPASVPGGRNGRGLLLLDALATSWGSTPSPGGKTVWFEIDVRG
jgi:anti-sigma regulatory factor (Ser/Thr protein kinase)